MRRLVLAGALALLAAAPAQAAKVSYGSDLSQTANLTDSHPEDWTAFPTATNPASPNGYTVTQAGEVSTVAFRGNIPTPAGAGLPNLFVFHIVVLRPQADGTVAPKVTSADFAKRFVGIDGQAVTTLDLQANVERMCVLPGDYVALATSGGYDPLAYPQGVPVQMFSRVPTSSYGVYKKGPTDPQFVEGTTARPTTTADKELLMRITIGTGDDARPTCRVATTTPTPTPTPGPGATPSPTPAPTAPAVSIKAPAKALRVRKGKVKLTIACPGPGVCAGTLQLSRLSKNYGKASFSIPAGGKAAVPVKLTKAARKGKGRVTVKAVARATGGQAFTLRFKISR